MSRIIPTEKEKDIYYRAYSLGWEPMPKNGFNAKQRVEYQALLDAIWKRATEEIEAEYANR